MIAWFALKFMEIDLLHFSAMNKKQYLKQMGIQSWVSRKEQVMPKKTLVTSACAKTPRAELDWDQLQEQVKNCTACSLHKSRTQTVFGVGTRQAKLLIIGEAPGANEDLQGEPFVGRAGQLLNAMLQAIGLSRDQIYIANILKCRPPNNRDPSPEEVAKCTPFLQQQINLLKPKLMLAVGRIAAHHLLATDTPMGSLRGCVFKYGEGATPLLVTYHPAYLLRSPREKRKAWQDMQQVAKLLNETIN